MAERQKRTRYRNTTNGFVGAVRVKANGEEEGVAVEPGGWVDLTDEEVELTAKAPRRPEHNPFAPHEYEIRDEDTGEVIERGRRPLLVVDSEERIVPSGQPIARGSRPPGEEVGVS
jgi:hypothetical protein